MTAAHQPIPAIPPLPAGSGPAAIRARLFPDDRPAFDTAYRQALTAAAETMDLTGVFDILETWRLRAIVAGDPDALREALARGVTKVTGRPPADNATIADLQARLRQMGA